MGRNVLWIVVGSLLFASTSLADIPLPKDLKRIEPRVSFEGIEKYPDYVFFLRFSSSPGNPIGAPHTLLPIKNTNPFVIKPNGRLISMHLLAMDRKEYEKRAKADAGLKWLTEKAEGVLSANVSHPETVVSIKIVDVPVETYLAVIKDKKLTVQNIGKKKGSEIVPFGWLPNLVGGIALTVSLTWMGLWLIRRNRRKVKSMNLQGTTLLITASV